jgi:PAS domain S-box-containing protein
MVKMEGVAFWAHLEATVAQDADGIPVFRIVMGENPERKRMEEALREREVTIRNMAEQLEDVLFATDDSGFITFVSPSALQMFGWEPEEMVGRSFIEFLPESEIPGAVAQFKDALASGRKTRNLSFVMKRKDESTFPDEVNSSVIWKDGRTAGKAGMIRDITERKRAEEALKESEERYRNQVEAINDVAYAIGSNGEFTYISPVVRTLLGYEPDEITGRHFLEVVHQEDHDLLTRKFSELREGVVSHDEYRVIGKSGDVKWVRSQTSPILDIGGFAGGRGTSLLTSRNTSVWRRHGVGLKRISAVPWMSPRWVCAS